jgi:serine/threonine-protein kinase
MIVLFPFLIPARPATVLAASLVAATMTPLGMAIVLGLDQRPWPEAGVAISVILPPFLCSLLAWVSTSAIYRLGIAVQAARRLGSYELTERLGGGGMGEVWRARHRLLARPAAVKLIKPEMLGAKDEHSRQRILARFEEEAQVTATLDSQHTVELYDFGVSSRGELFYVMELLDGVDAETLVQRFGTLPAERVAYLQMQA